MKLFKGRAIVMPLLIVALAIISSVGVAHAAKKTTAQVKICCNMACRMR